MDSEKVVEETLSISNRYVNLAGVFGGMSTAIQSLQWSVRQVLNDPNIDVSPVFKAWIEQDFARLAQYADEGNAVISHA